jgi:hypothetical protein
LDFTLDRISKIIDNISSEQRTLLVPFGGEMFVKSSLTTILIDEEDIMIGSLIAGWVLFIIGVLMYLASLVGRIQKMRRRDRLESLAEIKDTVEALAKLAEAFSKFSEDIQYLLLATGCLIAGIYLLQSRPF